MVVSLHLKAVVFLATVHILQALPPIWMHNDLLDKHYLGNSMHQKSNNVVKQYHFIKSDYQLRTAKNLISFTFVQVFMKKFQAG